MASQLSKNGETGLFEVRDPDTLELLFTHPDYWTAHLWVDHREQDLIDAGLESGEEDDSISEDEVRDNLIHDIVFVDPEVDVDALLEMTTDELRELAAE